MPGRQLLLVVLLVTGLGACRVESEVSVTVEPDGSGTVRVALQLDAEAVAQAEAGGGTLEDRIRLSDLEAAGWTTRGWERDAAQGAEIAFTKRFERAAELPALLAELSGPTGPLRDARLTRSDAFLTTDYEFAATADLRQLQTGVGADAELVAALQTAGVDPAVLDQRLLAGVGDAFSVRVRVSLPGADEREWVIAAGEREELRAESQVFDSHRSLWLVVAAVIAGLAVVVLVIGESVSLARRRRRRRAGAGS